MSIQYEIDGNCSIRKIEHLSFKETIKKIFIDEYSINRLDQISKDEYWVYNFKIGVIGDGRGASRTIETFAEFMNDNNIHYEFSTNVRWFG